MGFTAILPKHKPSLSQLRGVLAQQAQAIASEVKQDFDRTTSTWSTRVTFQVKVINTPAEVGFQVYTENQIYNWVNNGTGAHGDRNSGNWYPIAAHGKSLKFQGEFSPKTDPGVINSHQGGKFGTVVMPIAVRHPGIKPRDFAIAVKLKWEPLMPVRFGGAMRNLVPLFG